MKTLFGECEGGDGLYHSLHLPDETPLYALVCYLMMNARSNSRRNNNTQQYSTIQYMTKDKMYTYQGRAEVRSPKALPSFLRD